MTADGCQPVDLVRSKSSFNFGTDFTGTTVVGSMTAFSPAYTVRYHFLKIAAFEYGCCICCKLGPLSLLCSRGHTSLRECCSSQCHEKSAWLAMMTLQRWNFCGQRRDHLESPL